MVLGGGPSTPKTFQTFLEAEYKKYGAITTDLGMTKP